MWRPSRAQLVVGLGAAALGATLPAIDGLGAAGWVGGAVIGGALGAARRHPRAAWLLAAMTLLAMTPLGISWGVALLISAHSFCAGRWDAHRGGLAGFVALAGALVLYTLSEPEGLVPALLMTSACWGAARALRERELVTAALADRVREIDAEHEAHAALSVRLERARVASELHDIVGHAISVMVVQAAAGQRLAAVDRELTAEAFAAIGGAARQAEQDMATLVSMLTDDGAIGAAPDITLIEELIERATGTGLDVTLRLEGPREGLPAPAVQAAYRVVRESLTNALRYASGAPVRVLLRGEPGQLVVEVTNDGAPEAPSLAGHGTGNGLRGLRELVVSCGGRLDAGPWGTGGWRVAASIPRRVAITAE